MFSTQSPLELERIDLLTVSSHNEKYVLWQNGLDYKRELADELRLFWECTIVFLEKAVFIYKVLGIWQSTNTVLSAGDIE